ncbi:DUF806 family protein [Latilactobacillus sakei subsp. sakei]|uniref:DUF806 family protein n=1 Tax=Latilactobacillus TaxID=2767885 RepID=UPI000501A2BC|nr:MULTISPECIES: DUF806 family protein [Latilactobacillus]KGB14250.1 hypothetical protein KY41_08485 [Latilactobacillus sakei]MCS8582374.1 DUF806 family protein [Latilactobacillus curvatus]MCS8607016.1 DUF806 family protein [Latilactobacillus curvatus]MCS8617084.1 DUF806 family protein [Latilactobacillus curvatus]MDR7924749.1 DUF806 family protein [Latilactobacillus sakei subsp. sakei]
MLSVLAVKKILNDSELKLDGIFTENLPEERIDRDDLTDVLISRVRNSPTSFGNNDFNQIDNTVSIQVFYSKNFDENIENFEIKIMKLMLANGWYVNDNKSPYTDPDTKQVIKVFLFSKTEDI